jgi:hypothetical protein
MPIARPMKPSARLKCPAGHQRHQDAEAGAGDTVQYLDQHEEDRIIRHREHSAADAAWAALCTSSSLAPGLPYRKAVPFFPSIKKAARKPKDLLMNK